MSDAAHNHLLDDDREYEDYLNAVIADGPR